ncbi:MAG: aquaporin [Planctomycetaceae bacterium]
MWKQTFRQAIAEFLGTFVLVVFGVGVVAQVVLSGQTAGQYLSINIGWGVAVTLGIYCCAGVSGAHLNPAVTLALAVHRGFPWSKVLPYVVAQTAGAFVASAVVFVTYQEALDAYANGILEVPGVERVHLASTHEELDAQHGGIQKVSETYASKRPTAQIWATYPQKLGEGRYLSTFPGGLVDQIVGTMLLLLLIFAVSDERNSGGTHLGPVLVGAAVLLIGMTFGYNSGYAINPARDFGPRLFTFIAGWGKQVFTANDNWWWVPIVGPCLGALLGGYVYDLLIARHHPPTGSTKSE